MNSNLQIYRHQQVQHEVEQSSPVRLVVLLYDKAVALVRQSVQHIERKNEKAKGEALNRVVDILCELQAVLNREDGGMVAEKLDAMYEFLIREITVANLNSDPAPLGTVLSILEELRKGWQELDLMTQDGEVVTGTRTLEAQI